MLGVAVWWAMGDKAARIGLVIVDPSEQGRGIGRQLMDCVIDDTGERAVMLLATEAGRPLYESLGFTTVGYSQRHLGDYRHEPSLAAGIEPLLTGDFDAVAELDADALGVSRRSILEHLIDVGEGVVVRSGDGIAGFALTHGFGPAQVIGPIVAPSEDDAIALFDALAEPGLVRVDRTVGADKLGSLLERRGVEGHEVSHAMLLGEWPRPLPGRHNPMIESYAMASHAWG